MRATGRYFPCSAVFALVLTQGSCGPSAFAADAENGRKIAHQHCARCHVVSDANRLGGIGSTPSFRLLATAFKDWRTRFETFYARPPHPAFISVEGVGRLRQDLPPNAHPITLPKMAIDDLVVFAEGIRNQAGAGAKNGQGAEGRP